MNHHSRFLIRPADRGDVATILRFIRALAEFEHLAEDVEADEGAIARHLFGDRPYAECLLAEVAGEPAGFALYFHNFSTFAGRPGLYLEDLYVAPAFRRLGIGRGFFRALARIAAARGCGRIEWSVLDWNETAIAFYDGLGAKPVAGWTTERLARDQIEALTRDEESR